MKWNRKGMIVCLILFICLTGLLLVKRYEKEPVVEKENSYGTEEDVVVPFVATTTGTAVSSEDKKTSDKKKKEKKTKKEKAKEENVSSSVEKKQSVKEKEERKKITKTTINPTISPKKDSTPTPAVTTQSEKEKKKEVYLSIQCLSIMNHRELWKDGLEIVVPSSGYFYNDKVVFVEGETVYDIMKRVCDEKKIALDAVYTILYKTYYIKGIGNLYEFDCGEESGWKYRVNDEMPGVGCSSYIVKEGDKIEFFYDYEY